MTRRAPLLAAALAVVAAGAALLGVPACQPNLDDTVSIVGGARVLAIQSVPAEAPPQGVVAYTALVAQGSGPDAGPPKLVWDYCNARNPLTNLGPVSTLCAQEGNAALQTFGGGLTAKGSIPTLACASFGPNPPPPPDGGVPGQPVGPDFTGGYYQPVSLFLPQPGHPAYDTLYQMRLSCGFAGANEASQATLGARYHPNENPSVQSLSANGATLDPLPAAPHALSHGQKVTLEVAWPVCPLTDTCGDGICGADESATGCPVDCTSATDGGAPAAPHGCGGAERFVNFNLGSQRVVDQREGMHVSWYASAGSFDNDRTGRKPTDDATTSDDGWTPPTQPGLVHLWVVLRDDRGGVGWQEYAIDVQ